MLSARLNCLTRLFAEAVATSFCNSNASNTKIAIIPNEPTIAGVVRIVTVEVVTVEIIISPLNQLEQIFLQL